MICICFRDLGSPSRHTTIEVMSAKQPNAVTPTRMVQALAMAIYGRNTGCGLTPTQALAPSYTGRAKSAQR